MPMSLHTIQSDQGIVCDASLAAGPLVERSLEDHVSGLFSFARRPCGTIGTWLHTFGCVVEASCNSISRCDAGGNNEWPQYKGPNDFNGLVG